MSPLSKAKAVFFFILMVDLMSLYVVHMLNVSHNPAYLTAPLTYMNGIGKTFVVLLAVTGILLGLYCIFYLVNLVRNFIYIRRLFPPSRALFLFNFCMLLVAVATLCFGVYSPLYSNGHLFVFFLALCNLYVWALLYLNWPVASEVYEHTDGMNRGVREQQYRMSDHIAGSSVAGGAE